MKSQPSAAIENGFTAQLMNSVTPMPRQCSRTLPRAAKSILTSIGMIISQISDGDRQVDVRELGRADRLEDAREAVAERDARDDAQRDPEGQIAFEQRHRGDCRGQGCDACAVQAAEAADGVAADGVEPGLQRHPVEAGDRQAEEDLDAVLEGREGLAEGGAALDLRALAAAGSGTPQCAVIGWPGHTGQASPAALSQTVKMKSICGAPGLGEHVPALGAQSARRESRRPFNRSSA